MDIDIEFLGYTMSLKTEDRVLASNALDRMKSNMTRSKQLPFTIVGKEIFTRTYISSVANYRLVCRNYTAETLTDTQKLLDSINFGKRSKYKALAKYQSTTLERM